MVASAFTVTTNTEYNIFLLIICIVLLPISVGITSALHLEMNIIESLLFWLLICCTIVEILCRCRVPFKFEL